MMSDFAKNLKKFRKEKGYSQQKLADALHYGYTAIANYESGRNEPSIDDLIRIARTLNVGVGELVGMEWTTEEEQVIASFKKLTLENRKRILDLIEALQK